MTNSQSHSNNQNTGLATELVTLVLSPVQLCILATLVEWQDRILSGSEPAQGTAKALLFEYVQSFSKAGAQSGLGTVIRETQTRLNRIQSAINLEFYRAVFVLYNSSTEDRLSFRERVRAAFPEAQVYQAKLFQSKPGEAKDWVLHVYLPATDPEPGVETLEKLTTDNLRFDNLSKCWQGQKEALVSGESWSELS